jgi:hypothetical protein
MIKIAIENGTVIIPLEGKKKFISNTVLKSQSILKCVDFASNMAYGKGHHQAKSFGGDNYTRENKEIFINTLQGKIAELGFYNLMYSNGLVPDKLPDFGVWGKGKWEDCDFEFENGRIKVSLKSTKFFGNLLLLEKNRYNLNGEYIEPANGIAPIKHDFIFFSRVKGVDSHNPADYIQPFDISCEITGFITHSQFLQIIKSGQIINKGVRLGIPMIVDNYYVVASELSPINNFKI